MSKYIYELVDYSYGEEYYTLGIFESVEDALREIEKVEQDYCPISEFVYDDYEELHLYKRKIGWSQHGTPTLKIRRKEEYDEEKDEFYWRRLGNDG